MPRWIPAVVALSTMLLATPAAAEPLRVCATVPDLGDLAAIVGGADVQVTVFAKGGEDPHFVEARPSFVAALARADALVRVGLDLEAGWLPALLDQARNAAVLPGGAGAIDASSVVTPLDAPTGPVDRSMGDVHAYGNPHYLADPIEAQRVVQLLAERFAALRPAARDGFAARADAFRRRLGAALVGDALAAKYDAAKLATLAERGALEEFLRAQGDAGRLGGWLGRMAPYRGAKVVDDHPLWPYLARRFGLGVVGHMEPKPGIPPTTRHLAELVSLMQANGVHVILAAAYSDPRHARFLAEQTGARIAPLASQVGARPGTDTYLDTVDYNVRQLAEALGAAG